MKNILPAFLLLLVSLICVPTEGQVRNTRDYVTIRLVPNHADWHYRRGETVEITLSVERANTVLTDMEVRCEWGMELREAEKKWALNTGKDGIETLRLTGSKEPGFKTLKATVEYEGKTYSNYINLAFAPEQIVPTVSLPADFMDFWGKAIDEVRRVPLLTSITPRPEFDTDRYTAYEVRFQNHKKGCYLYGLLQIPLHTDGTPVALNGSERFPVMIEWPGAGVKPHKGIESVATEQGFIVLEMGINGIPVTQDDAIYRDLRANGMDKYQTIGLENRDTYYYKKVYAGTVKTIDMLCALPFVDTTQIVVSGGSQGGALSLVNAALDRRVKAVSAAYPALSEIAGTYNDRVGGWPQILKNPDEPSIAEKAVTSAYYDVVNFARYVSQPCKLFIGYNDRTCCPTSTLSVWSVLGEKCSSNVVRKLFVAEDCAHWQYPEHRQARHLWVISSEVRNE